MAFGEVQRREIIVVALDVGPLLDREAHVGEDGDDFVPDLAQGMDTPCFGGAFL